MLKNHKIQVAIIGLGYVGLPLAIEVSKKFQCIGFDINEDRVRTLNRKQDCNFDVDVSELRSSSCNFTSDANELQHANFYIITVPTPVNKANIPDLSLVRRAFETVSEHITHDDIVVLESTVFPGVTEEIGIPILEKSGLTHGKDFAVGYSPERINPADKINTLSTIQKVVSGSTPQALQIISHVYNEIIKAGVHVAKSIQVAEAAKVIENIQRDVNIALMNELSTILSELRISTKDVLDAASTKWNFLPFKPGLVGGHCIGVDPYYLIYKANMHGLTTDIISSSRRVNENMTRFVTEKVFSQIIKRKLQITDLNLLFLGATFKANCGDTRNSKVLDLIREFQSSGINVDVYDEFLKIGENFPHQTGKLITNLKMTKKYSVIIIAVGHEHILALPEAKLRKMLLPDGFIFDLTGKIDVNIVDCQL